MSQKVIKWSKDGLFFIDAPLWFHWYCFVDRQLSFVPSTETSSHKAINNGSACLVLFLSTTGLFPEGRKILEHETQSRALTFI